MGHVWGHKPWRKFLVASKASVVAAKKTGQILVRTLGDPRGAESSLISGKKVGYVRSSELTFGRDARWIIRAVPSQEAVPDLVGKLEQLLVSSVSFAKIEESTLSRRSATQIGSLRRIWNQLTVRTLRKSNHLDIFRSRGSNALTHVAG